MLLGATQLDALLSPGTWAGPAGGQPGGRAAAVDPDALVAVLVRAARP